MNLLFVSTVPVFPPTDGVRIPPAHYIDGLSKTHQIDFLLLDVGAPNRDWGADCAMTAQIVRRFWRVPLRRQSKVKGLLKEVLRQGPFYGSWEVAGNLPISDMPRTYDGVVACTPAAIAYLAQPGVRRRMPQASAWIAAMSDIYALVLARQAANASKMYRMSVRLFQRSVYALRVRVLAQNEMKMLEQYDRILVQTDKEYDWVCANGRSDLRSRTIRLPNAAPEHLFLLPIKRTGRKIVFVGSLAGLYGERFGWFLHKVWKEVDATGELSLTAIGRGASERLKEVMRAQGVRYVPFVEDLDDVYRNNDLLVAPIFKGYGLINKVIEAMAAGCVVIGDTTAFNGIPGFVPGRHGLVANSEAEFIEVLLGGLPSAARLNAIRAAARELIEQHFRWSQRIQALEKIVVSAASERGPD